MPVSTLLLDIPIGKDFKFDKDNFAELITNTLVRYPEFSKSSLKLYFCTDSYLLLEGPRESLITVKYYESLFIITVTIEYILSPNGTETQDAVPLLSYQDCKDLELLWTAEANKNNLEAQVIKKSVKTIPRILRGVPFDIYFPTSDERLLEYDIDKLLFDSQSPFQHIQILHSKSHGNILVLDDDPNLGESDAIYTESLLRLPEESYKEKEILVLGGGDGAVLNTLLNSNKFERPKKVTMIEIDEQVMHACQQHLRSLCGDSLDNLVGPNWEIIIGDCFQHMEQIKQNGYEFDYIVGDLTTIPISSDSDNEISVFIRKVLSLAFQILKPNGKYLTHAPGTSGIQSAQMLEKLIQEQQEFSLEITKNIQFVPSFHETWTFYEIKKN